MKGVHFGIVFMVLLALIPLANAECCGIPPACRGQGACNMFCCNCDDGCFDANFSVFKRSLPSKSVFTTFDDVDKNMDEKINFEEAETYLHSAGYNTTEMKNDKTWFESMDLNKNGVIDRREFDKSL
uniref:EF-hand domain-containing protein n=1 Tax=Panagrolaimus sp. ES5 TaxID=591445 RepID=A0AC34FL13_9BILA